jgi:hypothetical protein
MRQFNPAAQTRVVKESENKVVQRREGKSTFEVAKCHAVRQVFPVYRAVSDHDHMRTISSKAQAIS